MTITTSNYVTVALAATLTGLSQKAIRRKIEEGKWVVGREFHRSSDNGIFISIKGYESWVEQGSTRGRSQSESRSRTTASKSGKP